MSLAASGNEKKPTARSVHDIGYNLKVSVALVQVTATVRNRQGKIVSDLGKEDFSIYEDGEKQAIVDFANACALPKRILLLLDVSGSMRIQNKIGVAKKGIRTLIRSLHANDEVALIFFADGNLEIASNYTVDRSIILDKLEKVDAYGKTALLDAVRAAPSLARVENKFQRSMVLITDGIDNASEVSIEQALDAARKVDLPIYTLGFDPYAGREIRPFDERKQAVQALTVLAEDTGGRFTLVGNSSEMFSALDRMKKDLESQYLLGFISNADHSSRQHRIEVKSKWGYDVRARQGYYIAE